ncbi:MAG: hypothetical protein ACXWQO_17945 [Bdellovibrionota bacterium]
MKRWVLLAVAVLIVVAAGAILLTTRQAPDVIMPEMPPTIADIAQPSIVDTVEIPVPASEAGGPKHMSTEEFRALGAEVMKSLPTKQDLRKLRDDEAHGTPPALISAGVELGKIAEAVSNEPELELEAVTLYRECAVSPQHPDSIRALCFSNYKRLAKKTGADYDPEVVSKALRYLSEKLDF